MKVFIKLLFLSIVICSCKNKLDVTQRLFVLPNDRYPWWVYNDTITVHLKERFQTGHVEHFSINDADCRFLKNFRQTGQYDLQVLDHDKWIPNLTLAMPARTEKFSLAQDFDLDGLYDLSFPEYNNTVIYFFNREANQFNTAPVKFSFDYFLLDSSTLIYGANTQKFLTWNIEVFSIAGRIKKPLMKVTMYLESNNDRRGTTIKNAFIYKCNNGIASDTILLEELNINRRRADFSLREFMRSLAHNKKYN